MEFQLLNPMDFHPGFPHIAEQIFENFEDEELIRLLSVSETWRVLASNVLLQRWRGRFVDACYEASPELVKFLLANLKTEEIWNVSRAFNYPYWCKALLENGRIAGLLRASFYPRST